MKKNLKENKLYNYTNPKFFLKTDKWNAIIPSKWKQHSFNKNKEWNIIEKIHNLIIQHNCTNNARCNKLNCLLLNDKKYKLENRRKINSSQGKIYYKWVAVYRSSKTWEKSKAYTIHLKKFRNWTNIFTQHYELPFQLNVTTHY